MNIQMEKPRARSGERARSFHTLSRCSTLTSLGALPTLSVPLVFTGAPSTGMIDEITGQVTELSLQLPSPPWRLWGRMDGTESSNLLITRLVPMATSK